MPPRTLGPLVLFAAVAGLTALAGCSRTPPPLAKTKDPEVIVDVVSLKEVSDFEEFTGRAEAVRAVEIKPEVTGRLVAQLFEDGQDVTKGTELFVIEEDVYRAQRDAAKATVAQAAASITKAKSDVVNFAAQVKAEADTLDRINKGGGSPVDANNARAKIAVATASQKAAEATEQVEVATKGVAEANLAIAEKKLGYCRIAAPFDGRLSRRTVDPGTIVKENETVLNTLVTLDPIDIVFDIDERTVLRLRRLVDEGKVPSLRLRSAAAAAAGLAVAIPPPLLVDLGLADEDGYSFKGRVDFVNNQIDAATGTLRLRAVLDNPRNKLNPASFILSPGLFVRVRLPVGRPRLSPVIPDEAVGSDQGQKFVYVLNDKDEVVYRKVETGPQVGTLRAIEKGLSDGERVIVRGLQRVRPGVKVVPKPAPKQPAGPKA